MTSNMKLSHIYKRNRDSPWTVTWILIESSPYAFEAVHVIKAESFLSDFSIINFDLSPPDAVSVVWVYLELNHILKVKS